LIISALLKKAAVRCGFFLVCCCAFAALNAHAQNGRWYPEDEPAAALILKTVDGKEHDLAGYKGRVVLVNFWATWCGPCIAEMPSLAALAKKIGEKNIAVIGVNYHESAQKIRDFAASSGVPFPLLRDPWQEASETWKVRVLPTTFVIDANGTLRYRVVGEVDWSSKFVAEKLKPVLATKRVNLGTTSAAMSAPERDTVALTTFTR
jgi:cytochrome c biogenesis protein CcmG, thiol:disulfide interchange protein DsbE